MVREDGRSRGPVRGGGRVTPREYVTLREGRGARVTKLADGSTNVTCPAHEDRTPSLHVSEGDDGRVLLKCQAGCDTADVLAADAIDPADLFVGGNNRDRGEPEAVYVYTDEQGAPLFEVGRFEGKKFFQRRPGRDDWKGGIKGVRRVLYRLPEVVAAVEAVAPVYVVEGEKDVHALERAGVVATCNPMGAGKWRDEYAESLRGALVAVVADRDEPGREHARAVARSLAGVAISVEVVEASVGKDASDHLAAGKTVDDFVVLDDDDRKSTHQVLRVLDTLALVTTEPPPLHWLAEGVFCRGKLTMFGGREKRGKSLVQLALAVCMASGGGDVGGIKVKAGRVLLVDAENGEREIHRRLRAMGLAPGYASNFVVAEARGFELREHLDDVAALAQKYRVDLVMLDSFRSLWRGDERDEAEVAAALDPLRELAHESDTAHSLVHHAQKAGDEYRGSSAIGACVDWCVMLDRDREDPDKTRRRLTNPLARFAPERPDRWLKVCSEGDDGPVSLETAEPFVREHEAPVRDEIEAQLRAIIKRGTRGTSPIEGGTTTTPSWSVAEFGQAVGRGRDDKTLRRAVERLAALGEIHRNGDGRWQRSETLLDEAEGR